MDRGGLHALAGPSPGGRRQCYSVSDPLCTKLTSISCECSRIDAPHALLLSSRRRTSRRLASGLAGRALTSGLASRALASGLASRLASRALARGLASRLPSWALASGLASRLASRALARGLASRALASGLASRRLARRAPSSCGPSRLPCWHFLYLLAKLLLRSTRLCSRSFHTDNRSRYGP